MNDRDWDKRLRIRTVGREDDASPDYFPYEPTPYSVLERLAESGLVKRRSRLLDYGCGKGRAAFFMAAQVGCRVTGVDYSQKLIDIARENRRACPAGDRVRLVCGLAEQYAPDEEDTFFFFNPFSDRVFAGVLRRLTDAWYARPRPMTVICYYPSREYLNLLEEWPELMRAADIDCGDLFNGRDEREHIVAYVFNDA